MRRMPIGGLNHLRVCMHIFEFHICCFVEHDSHFQIMSHVIRTTLDRFERKVASNLPSVFYRYQIPMATPKATPITTIFDTRLTGQMAAYSTQNRNYLGDQ